jgi:hypothetical protein
MTGSIASGPLIRITNGFIAVWREEAGAEISFFCLFVVHCLFYSVNRLTCTAELDKLQLFVKDGYV